MRKRALPALLLLAAAASASAQPALVKDVNTTDLRGPFTFTVDHGQLGSTALFGFIDTTHGYELWRSDGTSGGTRLVKDLCPGACSSFPVDFITVGSTLYFTADDGAHGREVWKTDGTAEGTVLVRDIVPGLGSASPDELFELNGSLLFNTHTSDDSALWISDGTAEGTRPLKAFCSGNCSVSLTPLARLGSVMMMGRAAYEGGALWRTDGTEAGTVLVKDISPAPPNRFFPGYSPCAVFNGRLYFSADDGVSGYELWTTDGTTAGTFLVKDIGYQSYDSYPRGLSVLGDELLFSTQSTGLWKTDGTEAGTVQVQDVNASELAVLGTRIFFRVFRPAGGTDLWQSDGTAEGTALVKAIAPASGLGGLLGLTPAGDRLFFLADDGVHGIEPWASDGTEAGTGMLADLSPPPLADSYANLFSDRRLFVGGLWYYRNLDAEGTVEMFVTDGTPAGTRQLTEINHEASAFPPSPFFQWTYPSIQATDLNGTLLFAAYDGVSGQELWKSDGTPEGTVPVADIAPGAATSYPFDLTPFGSRILFNASAQLWSSDGTGPGTTFIASLNATELTRIGSQVFFSSGNGIFKTDGTGPGTVGLHNSDFTTGLAALGNLLLFRSSASTNDLLWRTDGTLPGTFALGGPARPVLLRRVGSHMLFSAEDATAGRELWSTDGTAAGTVRVKDIRPGPGSGILADPDGESIPSFWADLDGRFLIFRADDGTGSGEELWISDGTAAGTVQLADLNPGTASSEIRWLTAAPHKVYFVADDGTHGREPWVTDGTAAGTRMIADLAPGAASSLPEQLQPVGTQLLFSAYTPDSGREPWITDGDGVGTHLLSDLAPGATPSTPQAFTPSGGRVYLVATDAETGFELYSVPRSQVDGSADFHTLPPCRLVDTRQSGGPLAPGVPRTFDAVGHCGIPATARALAVNVTAIGLAGQGSVTVYRAQTPMPNTSTVSVSAGQNRAAGTMVQLGDGAFNAVANPETLSVHLVVDVAGYFE